MDSKKGSNSKYFLVFSVILCLCPSVFLVSNGIQLSIFDEYLADFSVWHFATAFFLIFYFWAHLKKLRENAKLGKTNFENPVESKKNYTNAELILKTVLFFLIFYGCFVSFGMLIYADDFNNPREEFFIKSAMFCAFFMTFYVLQFASYLFEKLGNLKSYCDAKILESF
ncbi:hypothetical protein L3Y34_009330 [Caenorhabditis briggsae]|uniref:Uncharacterized protein n=1 Tax=Caenorhabditis briggsae TaxID=6238 RepID=A0AAE9A5J2_CAEBR|nr:hypothetical protein L3Y34_009330 [Caenorhabditis briggsae]